MELPSFLPAGSLVSQSERHPRWAPGQPCAFFTEVFGNGEEGSGAAAALALMLDGMKDRLEDRSLLWVQDKNSVRLNGRPYYPGLPPMLRDRVIHVLARKAEDALFALEEGLRCRDMGCVIGEMAGNPLALSFTASRRLTLAAEKYDVPLFLVRHDAGRDLSSARMRWQIRSAASPTPRWNAGAPGFPSWRAELFRTRTHAPGEWILRDDGRSLHSHLSASPDHGDLAATTGDRSLAAG